MLHHSLLLFYRSFQRFKLTFFINLIGLAAGLICVILIGLWVWDECTIDAFHTNRHRLFQVMENTTTPEGLIVTGSQTTDFLGDALAAEIPEIEAAVVTTPPAFFPTFTIAVGEKQAKGTGKFVGKNFFSIFSYPAIAGNITTALNNNNGIILSESLARKIYNTTDVIGKPVDYTLFDIKKEAYITAVIADVPANTSEAFDFVMSFDAFKSIMRFPDMPPNWDAPAPFATYVTVREGASLEAAQAKVRDFIKNKSTNAAHRALFLKPYTDLYLYGTYENGVQTGGRIVYVRLFAIIAVFVVVIACINFMNLFTAQASYKLKEIGIKKAMGARRRSLIYHYLGEAILMSLVALFVALAGVQLLLPLFNSATGKDLALSWNIEQLLWLIAITLVTGLLAGSYPAIYLSRFAPAQVLRGKVMRTWGEAWARRGLVVFQFALSVVFIVCVWVVYRQVEFVQHKNLGYTNENLVYFEATGRVAQQAETFLTEIQRVPGVVSASSLVGNLLQSERMLSQQITWEGKSVETGGTAVNYGLLETIGLELVAGRTFSREFTADTTQFIINETAVKELGMTDPIGQKTANGYTIIGVVKDFHFQTLHEPVRPFRFRLEPHYATTIMVRLAAGTERQTLAALEEIHKRYNPGVPFDYIFQDQAYQAQYQAEKRVGILSRYFATVAIIISCLGLLGLAAFTTERRRREIAIRKVLGAGEFSVLYLLTRDFSVLVIAGIVIALPVSGYIVHYWLQGFAYRITVAWWYFAGAGMLALLLAWVTVGVHTFRATRVNPTYALKDD